jgi:DNA invertase Pin-like site-specific DNA recombinase
MKGFYIRVSTLEQNTDRQITGEENTYIDKVSGSIPFGERPQAKKLLEDIDKGIITEIEVHSIDRLGRSTLDIMQTIQALTAKGVNVISKKEGLQTLVDGKENPVAKLMIGILGTLAEFELSRLKERQSEGIAKAKSKGVYVGRNVNSAESEEVFMNKAKSQIILKHLKNGETVRRTALLSKSSINLVRKVDAISKANGKVIK